MPFTPKQNLTKACLVCGGPVKVLCPSRMTRTKYCSKKCRLVALNIASVAITKGTKRPAWTPEQRTNHKVAQEASAKRKRARPLHRLLTNGYVQVRALPSSDKTEMAEHRVVAEKILGRPLKKGEVVHHIDLNKANNHPSNLLICTLTYHNWLHWEMQRRWVQDHIIAKRGEVNALPIGR